MPAAETGSAVDDLGRKQRQSRLNGLDANSSIIVRSVLLLHDNDTVVKLILPLVLEACNQRRLRHGLAVELIAIELFQRFMNSRAEESLNAFQLFFQLDLGHVLVVVFSRAAIERIES